MGRRLPVSATRMAMTLAMVTWFAGTACLRNPTRNDPPKNVFQAVTGGDSEEEREGWNAKYRSRAYVSGKEPDPFLKQHIQLLPKGRTLLFPMEEGRNAVFLAKNGFKVTGIDYSDLALQKAHKLARSNQVTISGINADLEQYEFDQAKFDVIIGLDLYRPRLVSQIKSGLRRNGVILYTVGLATEAQLRNGTVPPHSVRPGELKALFSDFQVILYEETAARGADSNVQSMASIIARKP